MVTCACVLALPSKISASSSGTLCMVGDEYNFKTKTRRGQGNKKENHSFSVTFLPLGFRLFLFQLQINKPEALQQTC
jgi:hypothetical protein